MFFEAIEVMDHTVYKFGGTSNATAEAVATSAEQGQEGIITVVSAPGKLSDEQLKASNPPYGVPEHLYREKITNQLKSAYQDMPVYGELPPVVIKSVQGRYKENVHDLGITAAKATTWIADIPKRLDSAKEQDIEAFSSMGERLQEEVYQMLGFSALLLVETDASSIDAEHDKDWQEQVTAQIKEGSGPHVLAGNRYLANGWVKTYEVGGSDRSGAKAARAINADMYFNRTDTPAKSADPELIPEKRLSTINHLTYSEIRELGQNGSGLLHPLAAADLKGSGIPTEIKSTFQPNGERTLLTDEPTAERVEGQVEAISLVKDITVLTVDEKYMADRDGRVQEYAATLKAEGINLIGTDDYGNDSQLFMVKEQDAEKALMALNSVKYSYTNISAKNKSLIALVGLNIGQSARYSEIITTMDVRKPANWFQGRHSIRLAVDKFDAKELFNRAHTRLIEYRS